MAADIENFTLPSSIFPIGIPQVLTRKMEEIPRELHLFLVLLTSGEEQQAVLKLHPDAIPISYKKQKQPAVTRANKNCSLMAPIETKFQLGTTKMRTKLPWMRQECGIGPTLCVKEEQEYF